MPHGTRGFITFGPVRPDAFTARGGRQAWPTAKRSGRFPVGVRRFKSCPPHFSTVPHRVTASRAEGRRVRLERSERRTNLEAAGPTARRSRYAQSKDPVRHSLEGQDLNGVRSRRSGSHRLLLRESTSRACEGRAKSCPPHFSTVPHRVTASRAEGRMRTKTDAGPVTRASVGLRPKSETASPTPEGRRAPRSRHVASGSPRSSSSTLPQTPRPTRCAHTRKARQRIRSWKHPLRDRMR